MLNGQITILVFWMNKPRFGINHDWKTNPKTSSVAYTAFFSPLHSLHFRIKVDTGTFLAKFKGWVNARSTCLQERHLWLK
jgi:hypothetical protein